MVKIDFDDIERRQKALNQSYKDMASSLERDVIFNKDGSKNNAAQFSKRGHVAETMHAFTLYQNLISGLEDDRRIHIATDRVSFNGKTVPVNDQYKDIIVENIQESLSRSYQSKVCSTPKASIEAAFSEKYLRAGVTPLVPNDHDSGYSTIGISINGKEVRSDPMSLDFLNRLTDAVQGMDGPIKISGDKMGKLHYNVLNRAASDGAKMGFFKGAIAEVSDYLCNTKDDSKTGLQRLCGMLASTFDGMVRSAFVTEAAFSSNNKRFAAGIANAAYETGKTIWNCFRGGENHSTSEKGLPSRMGNIGSAFGSSYGPVGSYVGKFIGDGVGRFLSSISSSLSARGKSTIGTTISNMHAVATIQSGKSTGGFNDFVSDVTNAGFTVVAGVLNTVTEIIDCLLPDLPPMVKKEEMEPDQITLDKMAIDSHLSDAKNRIDEITDQAIETIPSILADDLARVICSTIDTRYAYEVCETKNEISNMEAPNLERMAKTQESYYQAIDDATAIRNYASVVLSKARFKKQDVNALLSCFSGRSSLMRGYSMMISKYEIMNSME